MWGCQASTGRPATYGLDLVPIGIYHYMLAAKVAGLLFDNRRIWGFEKCGPYGRRAFGRLSSRVYFRTVHRMTMSFGAELIRHLESLILAQDERWRRA